MHHAILLTAAMTHWRHNFTGRRARTGHNDNHEPQGSGSRGGGASIQHAVAPHISPARPRPGGAQNLPGALDASPCCPRVGRLGLFQSRATRKRPGAVTLAGAFEPGRSGPSYPFDHAPRGLADRDPVVSHVQCNIIGDQCDHG